MRQEDTDARRRSCKQGADMAVLLCSLLYINWRSYTRSSVHNTALMGGQVALWGFWETAAIQVSAICLTFIEVALGSNAFGVMHFGETHFGEPPPTCAL